MQVGTTKDQVLYNEPSAAVHPGTLAAGSLTHTYITEENRELLIQGRLGCLGDTKSAPAKYMSVAPVMQATCSELFKYSYLI